MPQDVPHELANASIAPIGRLDDPSPRRRPPAKPHSFQEKIPRRRRPREARWHIPPSERPGWVGSYELRTQIRGIDVWDADSTAWNQTMRTRSVDTRWPSSPPANSRDECSLAHFRARFPSPPNASNEPTLCWTWGIILTARDTTEEPAAFDRLRGRYLRRYRRLVRRSTLRLTTQPTRMLCDCLIPTTALVVLPVPVNGYVPETYSAEGTVSAPRGPANADEAPW